MAISELILFLHSACSKKKESSPRTQGKFVDSFLRHTTLAHIPSVAGGKFSIERIAALPCTGNSDLSLRAMVEFLQKGGPLIWVLLLCSIVALGTFLERLISFHRASIPVSDFLKGLATLIEKKNFSEAIQECACTPGPVARILHSAILQYDADKKGIKEAVQSAARLELPRLERNLPLLHTIAYGAPMIGLLGTVSGLLKAFQAIILHGGYTTAIELASGVYQSLLCSATGIAVGIATFTAYKFLSFRINTLMYDMEWAGIEIVSLLQSTSRRKTL